MILNKIKKLKPDARPAKVEPIKLSFTALTSREALPELGADEDRRAAIFKDRAAALAERKALQAEIEADKSIDIAPEVAALIGEKPSAKAEKRARVAELRRLEAVAGQAIELIEKRIAAARPAAERAICAAARPEAERRVAALVKALHAADAAHADLNDLFLAIEAQGVSAGGLGQIKPYWMGDAQDPQRRIAAYLREIVEAGYAA
ncbi:hypothetical protein EN858_21780 [Mesorhizobium sp. M4B.F.Ca.ET.215.01.1.1]|uniref:hypothetical protein n=1 Tax=unclassified Mesorhizobium TaxID=325217 RepID=UPI000FCCC7F3|nr:MULTISPECIES: hypothetical protein [unclassified Mesorhizobium]RVD40391.1 hypothetical protein EN741_16800 [Mesorhizobium sp. M4B.F.Ca.ET.019.03.1.1]TGQ08367.1 hypothetical protein EN858_21780 [Mesorhizobium sp. M4B.F.Ca.ET.215.01.1.1]TGQ41056.1 hypothetical protein EN863_021825 [Mesorhizobium sp. M00.F.Ca.ET.220.01.1.1]TGR01924.1 hypothetical protein EN846_18640 [Mesorhizobium sp. M4B.F.Ca.ET.203.01.1.1]TGT45391.1 hypothetical protein EN812_09640 [Mesorhizobium sp. M4B.F.Ca.ET.169.01.1.1]